MKTPTTACAQCTGIPKYQVTTEGMAHDADNFDRLSDHLPRFMSSPTFLASVADGPGQVIVRHFPEGWAPDVEGDVIAFAGVPPEGGDRIWFQNLPTAVPVPA